MPHDDCAKEPLLRSLSETDGDHDAKLLNHDSRISNLEHIVSVDPISPRTLALSTITILVVAGTLLAWLKVLPGEAIAGILGAIVGRLTSNLGGQNEQR